MASAVATVRGLDTLQKALRETPKKIRRRLRDMLAESADATAIDAMRNVPRVLGDLRRSIDSSGRGLTWRAGVTKGPVGGRKGGAAHMDPAIYGPMVERGTSKTQAHPFMRPAAESEAQRLPGRLRVLARLIETEAEE